MTKIRRRSFFSVFLSLALLVVTTAAVLGASPTASAQDWVRTGTNLGAAKIRIAAADFAPGSQDPQTPALKATFDATLFSDLNNAGIFDLVSKSIAPPQMPATPQQIILSNWSEPPVNAEMVAMGSVAVNGGRVVVSGWLLDAKNTQSPQVLGKQYNETASEDIRPHSSPTASPTRSSCASAEASTASPKPKSTSSAPDRHQRNLGDGLRRPEPAPGHPPRHHLALAAHLA